MDPADLERWLDRELKQVPAPRAPDTLLPRVLATADAWQRRPWYARGWASWPAGWQAASLVGFAVAVGGLIVGAALVQGQVVTMVSALVSTPAVTETLSGVQRLLAAAGALRIVWQALLEPLAFVIVVVGALLYLTCVAFGLALERVASGRVFPS
jgi:hypothetical protein